MSKVYTADIEALPQGGFDVEHHFVAVAVDEMLYQACLALQKAGLELCQYGQVYAISAWTTVEAYEKAWSDEADDEVRGKPVRSEVQLIHVTDDGIYWTYHSKGRDGVHWETDLITFNTLKEFFDGPDQLEQQPPAVRPPAG